MNRLTLAVPKWHLYQHREARGLKIARDSDAPALQLEDEIFARLYADDAEPLKTPSPLATWAKQLHANADALPGWTRLQVQCTGDAMASATAVETLIAELAPVAPKDEAPKPDNIVRRALTKALAVAAERAEAQGDALAALSGCSLPGNLAATNQLGRTPENTLAAKLRKDERLRRIAMLAGKFKRIAARKQQSKVRHGADEITDIEQGGDLARLLPSELMGLLHPLRKLALLRDVVEQRALQYRLEGTESLGKGPLVVCIDKSSSMEGRRDEWAAACALALLEIAKRQRRTFALITGDADVKSCTIVGPNDALPLDRILEHPSGGTNVHRWLTAALKVIAEHPGALRKADVVLITDGESDDRSAQYRPAAAALGVTTLGMAIGMPASSVAMWCDEAHGFHRLDEAAAEKAFTI